MQHDKKSYIIVIIFNCMIKTFCLLDQNINFELPSKTHNGYMYLVKELLSENIAGSILTTCKNTEEYLP